MGLLAEGARRGFKEDVVMLWSSQARVGGAGDDDDGTDGGRDGRRGSTSPKPATIR